MAQNVDDWYGNAQDGSWDGSGAEHEAMPFAEWHDGRDAVRFESPEEHGGTGDVSGPLAAPAPNLPAKTAEATSWLTQPRVTAEGLAVIAVRNGFSPTPSELRRALARANVSVSLLEAADALAATRPRRSLQPQARTARQVVERENQRRATASQPRKPAPARASGPSVRGSRSAPQGDNATSWTPSGRHCPSCGATVSDQAGCRCS